MTARTSILQQVQGLSPFKLWLASIFISITATEIIVCGMELLLKGNVTYDYLLTGFVAALLVASTVVAALASLFKRLKLEAQHSQQLAKELTDSEQRAKQAITASGLALWNYDLTTGNVYLSEGWSQLLGGAQVPTITTIDELTGLVPEGEQAAVKEAIVAAMKGHNSSSYQIEHRVRKLNGEFMWVSSEGAVVERDRDGRTLRMTGINRDITERKKLEKEILERREQMAELQTLQIAAQTAAAIAHELNQPLMAIASYSETALILLKAEKPNLEKVRKTIEGSERQTHRAGQSIRELLEFLSTKEFPTEAFDLNKEILDVLDTARSEHELQFHPMFRLEEGLPLVRANRIHVQRVLLNLLHNGIEAMQEVGVPLPSITVTVRTIEDVGVAQVTIQDNGPGVKNKDFQRLFEPFFTTKARGIGMGLAISRSLVEANGGQLWVDPQEGPGATFHFTLPLAI
ncbi:MAG TPA: ATP-binding protein [Gallionella sp.]|nr:ATP-binding protein [Gallionella sp.]